MPNWTSNALTTNNPQLINIFHECSRDNTEDIIDVTVSMPKELRGLTTGREKGEDGTWKEVAYRTTEDGTHVYLTDTEMRELTAKHGTYDWYAWAHEHWGTKWGACRSTFDFFRGTATVKFDTAWSPPETWLQTLIAEYPQGQTRLAYAEGGMQFYGVITYVDGELVEHEYVEDDFWVEDIDYDEGDDFADALTPACRDHITTFGLHTGG